MFGSLDMTTLQQLWWFLCSVLGALFVFLTFVQGGQTLLWQVAKTDLEKSLVINSLGRKWELTFTTLVTFGGALFAAFPKFYATSFGGAYWVWILILFTFIIQAVSYEYRKKENNLFGAKGYEWFLFINGSVGILLIGAAVGTFFTGSNFVLNEYNFVKWTHPLRGLEAAFNSFNVALGLFLVFNARTLGAMYLLNNINLSDAPELEGRLRTATFLNFLLSLPFLGFVLVRLLTMEGFGFDEKGIVSLIPNKYLNNLISNPLLLIFLALGLILVIYAVLITIKNDKKTGIWFSGLGTVLVGLTVFMLPAYNNTAFYPSIADLQSSLTIYNASSTHYTLVAMSYVALTIPFVLAYVAYVWKQMDSKKLSAKDIEEEAY
jgi:cytochrome d ubiquinol oxidase subunit II